MNKNSTYEERFIISYYNDFLTLFNSDFVIRRITNVREFADP